ncbi:hypothetical protein LQV05_006468 [Cryptococcus neoformans]|nr:hypothetical protein LQV05_006468 [Cryptococcus neoformans]
MSHSAATMGEFGNLILGKDEDKGCERLRKRIRQAKEEEEEGDDNNKVQWDTGLCDENMASASTSVTFSLSIPQSISESHASSSSAPSKTLAKQGILSGNERGKACSTEDQLQLLTEASKANSERRHRDILCIKEVKHVIVEDNSMSVDISAQSPTVSCAKVSTSMLNSSLLAHPVTYYHDPKNLLPYYLSPAGWPQLQNLSQSAFLCVLFCLSG